MHISARKRAETGEREVEVAEYYALKREQFPFDREHKEKIFTFDCEYKEELKEHEKKDLDSKVALNEAMKNKLIEETKMTTVETQMKTLDVKEAILKKRINLRERGVPQVEIDALFPVDINN